MDKEDKKYIDKEGKYDADKVKAKAKELCGSDYETITSLIGLMINEQKNN